MYLDLGCALDVDVVWAGGSKGVGDACKGGVTGNLQNFRPESPK